MSTIADEVVVQEKIHRQTHVVARAERAAMAAAEECSEDSELRGELTAAVEALYRAHNILSERFLRSLDRQRGNLEKASK